MLAIAGPHVQTQAAHARRAVHGIMPKLITEIFEMVQRVNKEEAHHSPRGTERPGGPGDRHYAYVLQTAGGHGGKPADLLKTDMIKKAYLGL